MFDEELPEGARVPGRFGVSKQSRSWPLAHMLDVDGQPLCRVLPKGVREVHVPWGLAWRICAKCEERSQRGLHRAGSLAARYAEDEKKFGPQETWTEGHGL